MYQTEAMIYLHANRLYHVLSSGTSGNLREWAESGLKSYFSHPRQSSGNHAPKCLPFSILCAKSVIIHTSITYNMIKTGVGVNCNVEKISPYGKS